MNIHIDTGALSEWEVVCATVLEEFQGDGGSSTPCGEQQGGLTLAPSRIRTFPSSTIDVF